MALQIPAAVRQMEGKPEKWMLKEAIDNLNKSILKYVDELYKIA